MPTESDDFGPIIVTAGQIQSWLSRSPKAAARAAATPETSDVTVQRAQIRERRRAQESPDVDEPALAALASGEAAPPRAQTPPPRAPRAAPQRLVLRTHSIVATLVLIVAVWAASGFYKVQPDQVGLVLRFGKWVDTRQAGLNYHLPYPIEFVLLPKVTAIHELKIGNGAPMQMLTGDENIVEATASISWRIKDPVKFLFNVNDPEGTVKVTAESAVRQIIGLNPIQSGLSDQRQKIADDAQTLLQRLLDSYDAGVEITQVQLQRVDPPLAVIDAFNDVQRARADQQRARNEAEAYRNDILPRARAEADRVTQEGEAYREQVTNQAHSDAERFLALANSYSQAPQLTARRLYLDTMETVLKSAGKILIDPSGHAGPSVIPYLSLGGAPAPVAPATSPSASKVTP
jgi:modulator of FtsH protease HflK